MSRIKKFNESNSIDINRSDWKDLMSHIDKIETIDEDEFGFGKFITFITNRQGHYCEVRLRDSYDTKVADGFGTTKMEAIYNCIIDFYENN